MIETLYKNHRGNEFFYTAFKTCLGRADEIVEIDKGESDGENNELYELTDEYFVGKTF